MDVESAIKVAEGLLPGRGPIVHERDPRWLALLGIRRHVGAEPEAVWEFVSRWGAAGEATLRHALAVCLLQELLGLHFMQYFTRVDERVREEHLFADTFRRSAKQGQSLLPAQAAAFDELAGFAAQFCGMDSPATGYRVRAAPPGVE